MKCLVCGNDTKKSIESSRLAQTILNTFQTAFDENPAEYYASWADSIYLDTMVHCGFLNEIKTEVPELTKKYGIPQYTTKYTLTPYGIQAHYRLKLKIEALEDLK